MVEAARPSARAIARRLSPSALSAASRSRSSNSGGVPPDIASSRIAVRGQGLTTRPRDVALHAGLRRVYHNLGIVNGIINVEALRTAQARFGNRALNGQGM